jgi:hypothetical protein
VHPGAATPLAGASLRGQHERATVRATLLEQGRGTTSPIPSTGRFPRAMVAAAVQEVRRSCHDGRGGAPSGGVALGPAGPIPPQNAARIGGSHIMHGNVSHACAGLDCAPPRSGRTHEGVGAHGGRARPLGPIHAWRRSCRPPIGAAELHLPSRIGTARSPSNARRGSTGLERFSA